MSGEYQSLGNWSVTGHEIANQGWVTQWPLSYSRVCVIVCFFSVRALYVCLCVSSCVCVGRFSYATGVPQSQRYGGHTAHSSLDSHTRHIHTTKQRRSKTPEQHLYHTRALLFFEVLIHSLLVYPCTKWVSTFSDTLHLTRHDVMLISHTHTLCLLISLL